ncbi:hypothetical protein AAMO2058_000593600 [Amorphochlora amoebiformis]
MSQLQDTLRESQDNLRGSRWRSMTQGRERWSRRALWGMILIVLSALPTQALQDETDVCDDPMNSGLEECREKLEKELGGLLMSRSKGSVDKKPSDSAIQARIWNMKPYKLYVFWIESPGKPGVDVGVIQPFEAYDTNTFVSHTFRFKDNPEGKTIGHITITRGCEVYVIPPDDQSRDMDKQYQHLLKEMEERCPVFNDEDKRWQVEMWADERAPKTEL